MAIFQAFRALRPVSEKAADVAALPYDVVDRAEAKAIGDKNPDSFLHVDRAEMDLPDDTDLYDSKVYERARQNLLNMEKNGVMKQDETPCYYIYELTRKGKTQTGLVGCCSIDDYMKGIVKKHELTREDKEQDRIRHVDVCDANTGPIYLACRYPQQLLDLMEQWKTSHAAVYDFVADDEIVKVHVHTNDPGLAIQKALTYGQLTSMKIDNMREEHQEKLIKDAEKVAAQQAEEEAAKAPKKEVGFISVSIGDGFGQIFRDLGVDYLIEGGQTMNPSTEDMLTAISKVNADHIFILPNNKNIILAANQAKALTKDKDIIVIPTKTVPQGITAVINYVPEKSVEDNEKDMTEEISRVKTGQITYAVRDTHIDDKEIHEGDIMGIGDHGMLAVGKEVAAVAKETVEQMVDDETELISIYYGEGFTEEEAEALAGELEEQYDYCDIEVNCGGQPIYYCIISVE